MAKCKSTTDFSFGVAEMKRTNIEFIVDLMDFSSKGPIMQAFVITALQKYADMYQMIGARR